MNIDGAWAELPIGVELSGDKIARANGAVQTKMDTPKGVSIFIHIWLSDLDSNQGSAD